VESVRIRFAFLTVKNERVCAFRHCSDRLCHVTLREVAGRFVFGGKQRTDVLVTCTLCHFVFTMSLVQSLSRTWTAVLEVGPPSALFSTH